MALLSIPIAKGGKAAVFSFDTDWFNELPAEVQVEIIGAGVEKFLNAGMSSSEKFPAPTKLVGEELDNAKTVALAKAEANLEDLRKGKIKVKYDASKAKAKPSSAEDRKVLSEAKRQAIVVLKNRARAQGIKPLSAVPASKWTELAVQLITSDPSYLDNARKAIAERDSTTVAMDLRVLNLLDPDKVAKAKSKSAKAKVDVDQLTAKQAGLPKPQGKGKVPPARPQHLSH